MRRIFTISTAMLTMSLSAALAQGIDTESIAQQLAAQGFTNIEIKRDLDDGVLDVEAWRGEQKIEISYDLETGDIVKQESERVPGGRDADEMNDDHDDNGGDDDGDDSDDDNGGDDDGDDSDDDNGGDDDGDDSDDDNGGDDDGDDSDDDNGGDDDGDDNGGDDDGDDNDDDDSGRGSDND